MKNQELPRRALDLSLAIYRITAKLPVGEVLVGQLRGLGNEIAATLSSAVAELSSAGDLTAENFVDIQNKINRLKIYLAIAKAQNWVKAINWSILDFEYYKLQQEVLFELAKEGDSSRVLTQKQEAVDKCESQESNSITSHNIEALKKPASLRPVSLAPSGLSSRQSEILDLLNKKGSLKMSALIPLFKDEASDRTLRNDLKFLLGKKLIKKEGFNKTAVYLSR